MDIAADMPTPNADVSSAVALGWNPTWNLYPSWELTDEELTYAELPVRSFTSRRLIGSDGAQHIADAELYLNGVEIAHVREYAGRAQFLENLARVGREPAEFAYYTDQLSLAPNGRVGMFIGWERLASVLTGGRAAL